MGGDPNRARGPRFVVGVGASAGGLAAFKSLLAALPVDMGGAFVLVQHLDPEHTSVLPELLGSCTSMTVRSAEHETALEPNTVYVIRPGTALAVREGRVELTKPPLQRGARSPVDHLFDSLAAEYRERSVGIVLSGAGNDGTAGLRALKAVRGLTIAQSPASCGQPGMPRSAIDAGVVDLVLDIEEMPLALERFVDLLDREATEPGPTAPGTSAGLRPEDLERVASVLDPHGDVDVRAYKPATVERRVFRRMILSGFEDPAAYLEHLIHDETEQVALSRDLLISVTEFFRDPEAFRRLSQLVVNPLVANAKPGETLRVWVPGCATGEEAYSLAIEFLEAIEGQGKPVDLLVYATDIDEAALRAARAGVYSASIDQQVTKPRLAAYFELVEDHKYLVRAAVRDRVSFAAHDLTRDPPFSRMHLVSCRNVLIYLTAAAQKEVLELLHFALRPDGYLFLGTSESTGAHRELFSTVSKAQHIYKKSGASRPIRLAVRDRTPVRIAAAAAHAPPEADAGPGRFKPGADPPARAILEAWVPPTIVVAPDGSISYMHGELGPYLAFPQGDLPRLTLEAIVRPALAARARRAVYDSRRSSEPVIVYTAPEPDAAHRIRLTAKPASGIGDDVVMLTFEEVPIEPPSPGTDRATAVGSGSAAEELERELEATREDLRSTVEELETSNEELRSANEESMSMNEELQSANEELEATSEELRSLNEELNTVNAQLRDKIEEVEDAHDDLHNFFDSTKIATLFLDVDLKIKRFTPAASKLLHIDEGDAGRLLKEVERALLRNELDAEARAVLAHSSRKSRELQTAEGRWVTRSVLPYRTQNQRVEGVVVTFVDITELKSATERLALREQQQAVVARVGLHALRENDLEKFMERAAREVQQALGADLCAVLELQPGGASLLLRTGAGFDPGLTGQAFVSASSDSHAGYTLRTENPVVVSDLEEETRFKPARLLLDHGVRSSVSVAIRDGDEPYGVLSVHRRHTHLASREDTNFIQAVAAVIGSAVARHQARVRLAVERAVAQGLSEKADPEDTLSLLLERMSAELGGTVAEVWWPNPEASELSCLQMHVGPERDRDLVNERFGRRRYEVGEGIIGKVFERGQAIWATDLGDPSLFMRPEDAAELGLRSGVALPIRVGQDVLAVISIFSLERMFAHPTLLRTLEAAGRSIGDFLVRSEVEQGMRRLAALTQASQEAILGYDLDGIITDWMPGAERLFGYTAQEITGQSIHLIVPSHQRQPLEAINDRIVRGETVEPFEATRLCKDGSVVEVSIRSSPVLNWRGEVVGISSADRDITDLKETERRLREADRQKDEFLAMLGHELRNPLAAIRSASDLIRLTHGADPMLRRAQEVLERQTTHMSKLLDGLLDVSRIIRGKINLERRNVDVAEICRDALSDMGERAGEKSLSIHGDISREPVYVRGDSVRLAQVVDNLLSNAVKYTPAEGAVTITLREDSGDNVAHLEVRDTGVGIEPDLLPYVFEVFRQSKQSLDRQHGGLGLGLALVKSLVDLHHGTVEARSAGKDQGTRIIVRLPLASSSSSVKERDGMPPGGGRRPESLRILLIEDNEDAAQMLAEVLRRAGHDVALASRGARGVELATEISPELVLCDLGLPDGMTGYEVAEKLRANPRTRHIPIVAVSGYGRPEDRSRGKQAGFDAHLTKPVDLAELERVIAELRPRLRAVT